jgi:hypothetical protein
LSGTADLFTDAVTDLFFLYNFRIHDVPSISLKGEY